MNWLGVVVIVVLLALVLSGGHGRSTKLTGDPSVPYEDDDSEKL